jgi:small subunit ribosomal protein S7
MRKRKPKIRPIQKDPRFQDVAVTRFVNNLMWEGKKSVAYRLFYDAMDIIKEKAAGEDPHKIWADALKNVTPHVEVRSRRIGGATFQIPTEIPGNRRTSIGTKWLIRFARQRGGKGMADKLASEILAASKGEGAAVKRKEDTHKMAESNRAFAHFRV